MGTPEFAVPSLDFILNEGYNVVGVITAPDKPAGRGKKIRESDVKKFALTKGLYILQPKNLKNEQFQTELRDLNAELFVVVAFRMLPEAVFKMPSKGTINLHASLLPNYRGAAPINWAIINGEKETGVTTFFIEKQIDTGEIIFQDRVRILEDMYAGNLHDVLSKVGAKLLCKTVNVIESESAPSSPQNIEGKTIRKAPKLFKEDLKLDWSEYYRNVFNRIRGLSPYPTAWSILKGGKEDTSIKILEVELEKEHHEKKAGTISSDNKRYLKVAAKDGWIILKKIIPQGRSTMDIVSFLNGNNITDDLFFDS